MENNEITKQMLDKIDALVRENETLKLANAAQSKQIEALETELSTLRTAVHQMNLDHKEQAQPDPKKAALKCGLRLNDEEYAKNAEWLAREKAGEDLARDFAGNFKRMFGLDLGTERAKAAIDCGDFIPAIENLLRAVKPQAQPPEYDRLRAQFPGIFEKYGPILGVAIIRKK